MTTKKIVIIVGTIMLTIGLLIAILIGGIVAFALYSVGKSEAAVTAKDFLRNNERLKQDIGDVKDFGTLVTGNINIHNNDGEASLRLKVVGERRTVNATVELMYRNGKEWHVTAASCKNDAGETINLLNPYESKNLIPRLVTTYESQGYRDPRFHRFNRLQHATRRRIVGQ